jgi:hypothetical protein
VPSRAWARRSSSFSLPPRRQLPGTRQSSRNLGGVRRAQAVLAQLRPALEPARARRDDERGLAARAELGLDGRDDDVHGRDAAVGRPCLLAVEHPRIRGLVVARAGAQRAHIGARVRLGHAERADGRLLGRAVALRHPLHQLLVRPRREDAGHRQRRAEDRQADPRVAPEQLLVDERQRQPGLVGPELRHRLEAVEPDLGRLGDHRPRRLLALVPLGGRRAHDLLGEAVDPVAQVALVLGELEREDGCRGRAGFQNVPFRWGADGV